MRALLLLLSAAACGGKVEQVALVPADCSRDTMVTRACDGPEDCRAGTACVLDAYGTTLCR